MSDEQEMNVEQRRQEEQKMDRPAIEPGEYARFINVDNMRTLIFYLLCVLTVLFTAMMYIILTNVDQVKSLYTSDLENRKILSYLHGIIIFQIIQIMMLHTSRKYISSHNYWTIVKINGYFFIFGLMLAAWGFLLLFNVDAVKY